MTKHNEAFHLCAVKSCTVLVITPHLTLIIELRVSPRVYLQIMANQLTGGAMFIAMNRFRIALGKEEEFIQIWKNRETYVETVPGFNEFHLLRGSTDANYTLFASHTVWDSKEAQFTAPLLLVM